MAMLRNYDAGYYFSKPVCYGCQLTHSRCLLDLRGLGYSHSFVFAEYSFSELCFGPWAEAKSKANQQTLSHFLSAHELYLAQLFE